MLVITPNEGTYIVGSADDGVVRVIDHQPENSSFELQFDDATNSVYVDQEYNQIKTIIQEYGYKTDKVYFDDYICWENFGYPAEYRPGYFISACDIFAKTAYTDAPKGDQFKLFVMMNKPRPHRLLVSAWLHYNLQTDSFSYTQSLEADTPSYNSGLSDLVRNSKYSNLANFLPKHYITYNGAPPENHLQGLSGNVDIWNNVLCNNFSQSTFSLITEPEFWEKGGGISEKYLMTLYGHCMPIFCSGYKIPDTLVDAGFDVFSDLINHDYQYLNNPVERVLSALDLNKDLLMTDNVKKTDYTSRHEKNLKLITTDLDKFSSQYYSQTVYEKYAEKNDIGHVYMDTVSPEPNT